MADDMLAGLRTALTSVSRDWKQAKRSADKQDRVQRRALEKMRRYTYKPPSIKDAAWEHMETAYLKASANGTLPANARMIMYAIRPLVLATAGEFCTSSYFTQTLLPDFMEQWNLETQDWNVVYDARGHFQEPHGGQEVKLGTLGVRNYIASWQHPGSTDLDASSLIHPSFPTAGPANRYRFALFIEKEGFNDLLAAGRIAERFDIAIMSTKGMSVTAARLLVEELSERGVTILVCHDFDKSGISIMHTLGHSGRRYQFSTRPNVVDIGLRLADVQAMDLASEPVTYRHNTSPRYNLRDNGASDEEIAFLVGGVRYGEWHGQRVELNAMMADQFVTWIEGKLEEAGAEKVVPAIDVLDAAYRRAVRLAAVEKAIETALEDDVEIDVPAGLAADVAERIAESGLSWDDAVWDIVRGGAGP